MHEMLALATRQHGVVTTAEAQETGVTRAMRRTAVKNGVLLQPAPNVFVVAGSPATWRQRLLVAVKAAGDDAAACLSAAAYMANIRTGVRRQIEILVEGPTRSGGSVADRVHRTDFLPPQHTVLIDGIRCTSPARTVMDLCGRKPFTRVSALDQLDRARRLVNNALLAGVTAHELRTVIAESAARGRNGCGVLREVVEDICPSHVPTESELEDLLLAVLASAGLPLPCRQREIGGTFAPLGRFDFYYPEYRLVLECDSHKFHAGWAQQERDRERDFELAKLGIRVLRPTWRLLTREPQLVVAAIRSQLFLGNVAT